MAEMRQPGEQSTSAVLWHPFRNELVTCNSLGHVQVRICPDSDQQLPPQTLMQSCVSDKF